MNLEANFEQISKAVLSSPKNPDLVASSFSSRIYHSKHFIGRLWIWIYAFIEFIEGAGLRQRKLASAIQKSQASYLKMMKMMDENLVKCREGFRNLSENKKVDQKEFTKSKFQLRQWRQTIVPTLEVLQQHDSVKVKKIAEAFTPPSFSSEKIPLHFFNLEARTLESLPISALLKLGRGEDLRHKELYLLDNWTEKVNRWCERKLVDIRAVHRGIKDLLIFVTDEAEEKVIALLGRLEAELAKGGVHRRKCEVFKQKDLLHETWRDRLASGQQVGSSPYSLGQLWSHWQGKRTRAYTVLNQPMKILLIGENEAQMGIKMAKMKHISWGIKPVEIEIDGNGRFAVLDIPGHPFNKIAWDKMSQDNKQVHAMAIAAHLSWMVQEKKSPKNLKASTIYLDTSGCLRTSKPYSSEEFLDLPVLEQFCRDCVGKRDKTFKYLMEISKLSEHPLAIFFRKVVEMALKSHKEWKIVQHEIEIPEAIDRPIHWQRASQLFEQTRDLLNALQLSIGKKESKDSIVNRIWEIYRESSSASILPIDLHEKVKEMKSIKTEATKEDYGDECEIMKLVMKIGQQSGSS